MPRRPSQTLPVGHLAGSEHPAPRGPAGEPLYQLLIKGLVLLAAVAFDFGNTRRSGGR